jgi:VIT1/CCC1 family predicted Fe2+/Mn2+ transporter
MTLDDRIQSEADEVVSAYWQKQDEPQHHGDMRTLLHICTTVLIIFASFAIGGLLLALVFFLLKGL